MSKILSPDQACLPASVAGRTGTGLPGTSAARCRALLRPPGQHRSWHSSLKTTGAPQSPNRARLFVGRGMGRLPHVAKRYGCSWWPAPRFGRGQQSPTPVSFSEPGTASALFFIARNEGSSMVPDNYACIHRIKYRWSLLPSPLGASGPDEGRDDRGGICLFNALCKVDGRQT